MKFAPIQREIRLPTTETVSYIEPPHVILCSDSKITPEEMIMTAICWTLGTRPTKVPVRQVHMTPELAKAVETTTNMIHSDQILVFLGMAGLMTIVKRTVIRSRVNSYEYHDFHEYLINRWQDVCSTTEIENIFTSGVAVLLYRVVTLINTLRIWQVWIKSRPALSRNLLVAALDLPEGSPMLVKTAMAKVKIEIQYFGMEMILKMDAFVSLQNINVNKAIFVPDIAQQAADLRKAMDELRIRYGDRFPYLKIYRLEGTDRLNYKKYPDLFYAVIATGVANNSISLNSVKDILMDLQTRTDRHIIDAEVKKTLKSEMLDEVTTANLRCLNIDPRLFCQRREENDYENEMLSIEGPKD